MLAAFVVGRLAPRARVRGIASTAVDPFKVLGLPRTASVDEIKQRYRELARRYHPDLSDDADAPNKMAQLSDAYDMLTDKKRRKEWEERNQQHSAQGSATRSDADHARGSRGDKNTQSFGSQWTDPNQMFSEYQAVFGQKRRTGQGPRPARGEDVAAEVDVTFLQAMRGALSSLKLKLKQKCTPCNGSGAQEGTNWSVCRVCNGTGVQRLDKGLLSMGMPCQRCNGVGELLEFPCEVCKGDGVSSAPKEIEVKIPAGVRDGMELRIPHAGHAGTRGGKPGHLYVTVKVKKHSHFRHVDDDLHIDVGMSLKQALLGGRATIPSIDGNSLKFDLVPPVQPNSKAVLREHGPPRLDGKGSGNMVVHFRLELPSELTDRQRELLVEFDQEGRKAAKQ